MIEIIKKEPLEPLTVDLMEYLHSKALLDEIMTTFKLKYPFKITSNDKVVLSKLEKVFKETEKDYVDLVTRNSTFLAYYRTKHSQKFSLKIGTSEKITSSKRPSVKRLSIKKVSLKKQQALVPSNKLENLLKSLKEEDLKSILLPDFKSSSFKLFNKKNDLTSILNETDKQITKNLGEAYIKILHTKSEYTAKDFINDYFQIKKIDREALLKSIPDITKVRRLSSVSITSGIPKRLSIKKSNDKFVQEMTVSLNNLRF